MEPITPELQSTTKESPERALLVEVLLLAVVDSLGGEVRKVNEYDQELARVWLERSPVCRYYCTLVDIDYQAMIDRLNKRWRHC